MMRSSAHTRLALVLAPFVLVLAPLVLALSGCGPRAMGYHQQGRTVETDPLTGDTVITQFWVYDNGERTATFKRIPKGNTDTRGEAEPPLGRFVED